MLTGYCGNVHPGRNLEEVQSNLTSCALAVKESVSPDSPLPIGLWFSETVSHELADDETCKRFSDWLAKVGLLPFTLNGFPYGDFHQPVVKHQVYEPDWSTTSRLDYTLRLAEIHHQLLPAGLKGSISTLPLGWPGEISESDQDVFFRESARQLICCAEHLNQLELKTGRQLMVCLEPEPGCWLDMSGDVVVFFERYLFNGSRSHDEMIRRYLGVCHDVCHAAVMFESQEKAIQTYQQAGISIGKIQVSSALEINFESKSTAVNQQKIQQLASYVEPRYLHQTSVKLDEAIIYYEDLPMALHAEGEHPQGQWRVHFHVPVFASQFKLLQTTQPEIGRCMQAIEASDLHVEHFEVETYTWNVLPEPVFNEPLSKRIAMELGWLKNW